MSARIPYEVTVYRVVVDSVLIYAVTAQEAMEEAAELEQVSAVISAEPAA